MIRTIKAYCNWILFCFTASVLPLYAVNCLAQEQTQRPPLKLPPGFEATLFCDNQMCPDIQCLTTDPRGNLVASGPGYIRTLFDTDQDGRADAVQEFAAGPRTGAQGLFFDGNTLYCIGDNGLLVYHDADQNGIADGPPEIVRPFKAGGEHDTHAIRKGPDGWWYLIAGNMAGIQNAENISSQSSILSPQAGVLFRVSPDFSETEILSDGLRNAYDFDFDSVGDLFTYDSDGERDISLPWYRPTRVFHTVPGMNHGWVSRSWKKPNYFEEMSPVLAELGRGSPTGIVCYRHNQFPEEFQGTLFVLDWTYGRVVAVKKKRQGASWIAQAKNFVTASGDYGFAPTDAVVGPKGSLYISVGGRGTQGSIYRISYSDSQKDKTADDTKKKRWDLDDVLNAPQPLSAWSRSQWEPKAVQLGEEAFIRAALNVKRSVSERIRSIEILTEKFQGPDIDFMRSIALEESRELRARAVWAYGRSAKGIINHNALKPYLHQSSPAVVRNGLEILLGSSEETLDVFANEIAKGLNHPDRVIHYLATQVAARMSREGFQVVGELARKAGWTSAMQTARSFIDRGYIGHPYSWHEIGLSALRRHEDPETLLAAVRLIQHSLGRFGESADHAAVFDGYLPRAGLPQQQDQLNALRQQVISMYPTGNHRLDWELGRLTAMLSPAENQLLDNILKQITPDSEPVSDLHHLIISACLPSVRTEKQSEIIANSLLGLSNKIEARGLVVDRNWEPRLSELYAQLVLIDQSLPRVLAENPSFGNESHVLFVDKMSGETRTAAYHRYLQLLNDDKVELTPRLLSILFELPFDQISPLLQTALEDHSLRPMTLLFLAKANRSEDHTVILSGLLASQWDVVSSCLFAISQWKESSPEILVALLNLLNRAASDQQGKIIWKETLSLARKTATELGTGLEDIPPESEKNPALDAAGKQNVAEQWLIWTQKHFPTLKEKLTSNALPVSWEKLLTRVEWEKGDPSNGTEIFRRQQCSQCHGGRTAIGPDLRGAATRFSLQDLLAAIVDPHRNVSSQYRATMLITEAGKAYTGIIIYESIDGLLLRDSTYRTIRINSNDIEERKILKTSLMPENLLKDCTDQEIADLFAYLKSLK